MPIISNHPKHYTTWNLVSQVYNRFSSDKTTVIDTMWLENDQIDQLVVNALQENHKVVIMNWLDELRGEYRSELYENTDVMVLKYLWPLLHACEQHFQPLTWEEVQPTNFDYYFMCYGFKSKPWRRVLYNHLQDTKVKGLLSYGPHKNFTEEVKYTYGNTNMEPSNDDPNYPKTSDKIPVNGGGNKKQEQQYSGERKLIGIGLMHKSNLVPIWDKEGAEEISKMRRN